ncbi:IS110 family RNA-guided transposase [Tautonia rosea]|uniref:IS110 family transposase n=1 Tax=Tautonia rosea TaxID=2728037 RepID=UPI0014749DDB|nr:IS110 family transposase [Tautonia rosea]
MRPYQAQHRAYCGVDLHARTMFLCILDPQGKTLLHEDIPANPDAFLQSVAPHRDGLVVACECTFCWYWLADTCREHGIPFVLGHALEMRAIHGTKTKSDRIDSEKIAHLLRAGLLPQAYAYPAEMRATRDLLRRRSYLVRRRSEALTHVQLINWQYQHDTPTGKLRYASNRAGLLDRVDDECVRRTLQVDLELAAHLDGQIAELEAFLAAQAKGHDLPNYYRLRSIPGVGKVLALTLLYEIGDIRRFDAPGRFLSYARLVRPAKESAGKVVGRSNAKLGNAHLKWAFREAAALMTRHEPGVKAWAAKKAKATGKGKAQAILAARLGRAVYAMLRRGVPFDAEAFMRS